MQKVTATTGGPGTAPNLHACRLVESLRRGRQRRAGRELRGPEVKNKQSQSSGTSPAISTWASPPGHAAPSPSKTAGTFQPNKLKKMCGLAAQ